jgi:CPA2 family monovalent cation:H+ antiporter-2
MVVSISSTMIGLRLLEDQGVVGAPAGRAGIAFLLVQDIAVVLLIVMIPIVAGEEENVALSAVVAVGKAAGMVAGVWIVGVVVLPWLLRRVTLARSRELFLLSVVALALGTASVSSLAGLGLAFGAFLAGLLVSESEYAHQTLAEVFPLREVFAVVFFVAMGMLIDPASFVEEPFVVFGVAALGIVGKTVLVAGIAVLFSYSRKAAVVAGLALGNMGEFSFVLVEEAVGEGVFDSSLSEAMLAAVLVSIAVSPLLVMGQGRLLAFAQMVPGLGTLLEEPTEAHVPEPMVLANHVVIVGFAETGQEVARALGPREFRYLVVDQDPVTIRMLANSGVPCILGDPALPAVLEHAGLDRARALAVTLSDVAHGEAVVTAARRINPGLDVIAMGVDEESHERLRQLGVAEVVHSEFEVGLEFVRHTLHRYGVSSQEIQALLSRRRRDYHAG